MCAQRSAPHALALSLDDNTEKNHPLHRNDEAGVFIVERELSVLLQVVDDTNSMCQRRNNILSKSSKYIGINVGKISNGLYCFYLLFGKDKKK